MRCHLCAAIAAMMLAPPGWASPQLLRDLGSHGCTLGADSEAALLAAGHGGDEIEALRRSALAAGEAAQWGAYTVFAEEVCTIRLPDITTTVRLTDKDIAAIISPADEYDKFDEPGCFLFGNASDVLAARDGWTGDQANEEYLRFLAVGIIAGDLRFYSESPLQTPPGFRVMTGKCGAAKGAATVKDNHDLVAPLFGAYIRAIGETETCSDHSPIQPEIIQEIRPENTNAWLGFEFTMIAMAAGWYEGMTATERGVPRPPFCRYD